MTEPEQEVRQKQPAEKVAPPKTSTKFLWVLIFMVVAAVWMVRQREEPITQAKSRPAAVETQKSAEKQHAEQEEHLQAQVEFAAVKKEVMDTLVKLRKSKDWIQAKRIAAKYSDVDDADFKGLVNKIQADEDYLWVKKLPASKIEANYNGYKALVALAPDNALYKQKMEHYGKMVRKRMAFISTLGPKPTASAWDGHYYEVERYLKSRLKDPGSLEWNGCTEVYTNNLGWLVGCQYRAKNSFGGYVIEQYWFTIKNGRVVKMEPASTYTFQ
ncbi:hypothetical protein ACR42D_10640 [Desulfovibrio caledoniensis]